MFKVRDFEEERLTVAESYRTVQQPGDVSSQQIVLAKVRSANMVLVTRFSWGQAPDVRLDAWVNSSSTLDMSIVRAQSKGHVCIGVTYGELGMGAGKQVLSHIQQLPF